MPMPREMKETEKQAHLFERLEKLYENFTSEYEMSRVSWVGTLESFKIKMIDDWKSDGAFGAEEEDE